MKVELFLFSDRGELNHEIPKSINVLKSNYLLTLAATPLSGILRSGSGLDKLLRILLTLLVRMIGSQKFFKFLFSMEKQSTSYDVAISYFNDVPGGYLNRGSNQYISEHVTAAKKIGWIHTDLFKANFDREDCLKTYRDFDSIVNVSKAGKEQVDCFLPEYKNKSYFLHNYIPIDTIREQASAYETSYQADIINFVTVARIDNGSKRIDRIIEVVHLLQMNGYENFKWWIIGDGPDSKKNQMLAKEYELNELIEFTGEKTNPYPFIKSADAFILASDYEGFPMVIGESLALGTPVITTAYASAKEQLKDGVNGLIVQNNTKALFEVLKSVLDDKAIILKLQVGAKGEIGNDELALSQLKELLY